MDPDPHFLSDPNQGAPVDLCVRYDVVQPRIHQTESKAADEAESAFDPEALDKIGREVKEIKKSLGALKDMKNSLGALEDIKNSLSILQSRIAENETTGQTN